MPINFHSGAAEECLWSTTPVTFEFVKEFNESLLAIVQRALKQIDRRQNRLGDSICMS
jgi:hypothetical protein